MKTITGKINFLLLGPDINEFYRDMDCYNCEIVHIKRRLFTYTVSVKGRDKDLMVARWYFNHG